MSRLISALVLAAVIATPTATVAEAHTLPGSPLDGRWTFTWSASMVKSHRAPPGLAGRYVVQLRDGQLTRLIPHPVLSGARFTIKGTVATFVFPAHSPFLVGGKPYVMEWSIYRDRLTWSRAPGRASLIMFFDVPWTRVR